MMVDVEFQPAGKRISVEKGLTILEVAQLAGIKIRSVCGGTGDCGKCKVIIDEGKILERSELHKKFLAQDEIARGYHLACQTQVFSDTRVTVPPESRIEGQQILTNAFLSRVKLEPCCRKQFLKVNLVELEDKLGRVERVSRHVKKAFGQEIPFSDFALLKLKKMRITEEAKGLTLAVNMCATESEVVDIDIGDTSLRNYGLAIDVGTTKIVIYLVSLRDGEIIDVESGYNEQLIYGEDLLSRIDYAFRSREGLSRLQKASVDTINKIIGAVASRNSIAPHEIIDICVGGNTVMTYLLAGLDPSHLVDANVRVSQIGRASCRERVCSIV